MILVGLNLAELATPAEVYREDTVHSIGIVMKYKDKVYKKYISYFDISCARSTADIHRFLTNIINEGKCKLGI